MNSVVCTHQVLLDALIHGFVHLDMMALLIFDEAHRFVRSHPVNKIMQNFYHAKRREGQRELPSILEMTANPVVRRKGEGLQ
jgi:ERCC4-related helicase